MTKNGKYQHSRAGIPRLPKNSYYRYRTNVDPSTEDWIITGAIKVNKVLSRDEVDSLNAKAGIKPLIYANEKDAKEIKKQIRMQLQAKKQINSESMKHMHNIIKEETRRHLMEYADKFKDQSISEKMISYADDLQNDLNAALHNQQCSKHDIVLLKWQEVINKLRMVANSIS